MTTKDRRALEHGDKDTARMYKKLYYSPTPTGSLDVLLMDYFGFIFGYFHIGPTGKVDFEAQIKPNVSIHRKPIPDTIRDIRFRWLEIRQFDETYKPKNYGSTRQESLLHQDLPIINLGDSDDK